MKEVVKNKSNNWKRWDEEASKFKAIIKKGTPPEVISRHWQRNLMMVFMKDLSKNVLSKTEDLDQVLEKVIEAIQVGYGFKRVRFYQVTQYDETGNMLELKKISKKHDMARVGLKLETKYGEDDAVDTLKSKEPLIVDDASEKLRLIYREKLNIRGPYAAIPLFAEDKPYGLICADTVSDAVSSENTHRVNYLEYRDNFDIFSDFVMASIAYKWLIEQKDELLHMRDNFLNMLKKAVGEAHSLRAVLKIIRDSCHELVKDITRACLSIRDPQTDELTRPTVQCIKPDKECSLCFMKKTIIEKALKSKGIEKGENKIAIPILLGDEVIGVLYLEGKKTINLNDNEVKVLDIFTSTTAILIKTARDYEVKINQGVALFEAAQFGIQTTDFRKWFRPLMEKVMKIVGDENRNFHLVLVEELEGNVRLIVKETSNLHIDGKSVSFRKKLLGIEVPREKGLSWRAYKSKKIQIVNNVKKNQNLPDEHPDKLPYYEYDDRINSEFVVPLKIREAEDENVIGLLVIDSIREDDFHELDLKFCETIASFLAIAIYNQKLQRERFRYQETLAHSDRANELSIFLNSFFHDIKKPISELNSAINLIEMNSKEKSIKKYIKKGKGITKQMLTTYEQFVNNFARTANKRESVHVRKLIDDALETVEKSIGLGIEIEGNYKESIVKFECFPTFIIMAFRSIINNAIQFSRGMTSKRYLKIDIHFDDEEDIIAISFESSTTQYIPEDKLGSIFKPFVGLTSEGSGSGLGLFLAGSCVKLHNGEINAKNIKDKSAVCFKVTLPVIRDSNIGVIR